MISSLPSLWLSDPAWCAMDPMARGFHTQLVLLAARSNGELTTDQAQWRRWLGIPEADAKGEHPEMQQWVALDAQSRGQQLGRRAGMLEQLWEDRWYPMICGAWQPGRPGFVTCQAAQLLAGSGAATPLPTHVTAETTPASAPQEAAKPSKPAKARKKAGAKPSFDDLPMEAYLEPAGPIGQGIVVARPLEERLSSQEDVLALWHVPVNRTQRLNVWSVGLTLLSRSPSEETNNRSFLASLIRQYGERKVAAAVGEISGRATMPADPRSFLRAILRRETEGNPAAQRARETRASIPL